MAFIWINAKICEEEEVEEENGYDDERKKSKHFENSHMRIAFELLFPSHFREALVISRKHDTEQSRP